MNDEESQRLLPQRNDHDNFEDGEEEDSEEDDDPIRDNELELEKVRLNDPEACRDFRLFPDELTIFSVQEWAAALQQNTSAQCLELDAGFSLTEEADWVPFWNAISNHPVLEEIEWNESVITQLDWSRVTYCVSRIAAVEHSHNLDAHDVETITYREVIRVGIFYCLLLYC
jgi:hypothetical protein